MIHIENLSVTYPDGKVAIKNINFDIEKGENVAVIGANGAGKTSLIMSIVGLIDFKGIIKINNITLEKKTEGKIRRETGVILQNPDDQLFMPTVYDDIAFGLRNMGIDESEIKITVEKCIEDFNVKHLINRTSSNLSGGEKRMVSMAAVLIMNPKVLILDEPTAFLDPKARRRLINKLNELPQTKIIATHDLTFAFETCKRVILIKNGVIFANGNSKDLLFDEKLMDDCGVEAIKNIF